MKHLLPIFILASFALSACSMDATCDYTESQTVLIHSENGDFYIDAYEASRANATAETYGTGVTLACNYKNAAPWAFITYEDAYNACYDAGKRLCTKEEWMAACAQNYPYGATYIEGQCNDSGLEYANTGSYSGCATATGVFDLSGNLREWVEGGYFMGGSYDSVANALSCSSAEKVNDYLNYSPTSADGFRCCQDVSLAEETLE